MSKIKGAIVVDTERCKGCALCVEACPQDVIALALKRSMCMAIAMLRLSMPMRVWGVPRAPSSALTAASLFIVRRRTKQWQIKK